MNKRLGNRLDMMTTVKSVLEDAELRPIWHEQNPRRFTALATLVVAGITALHNSVVAQSVAITGYTADKLREEEELEAIAFSLGNACAQFFTDRDRPSLADAASVTRSLSGWEALRDVDLIAQSQILCNAIKKAIAEDEVEAADYGLTPVSCGQLEKELADFRAYVGNPSAARAGRKTATAQLRPEFKIVTDQLKSMDGLVHLFKTTDAGERFASTWYNARNIRNTSTTYLALLKAS